MRGLKISEYGSATGLPGMIPELTDTIVIPNNDDIRQLYREAGVMKWFADKGKLLENGVASVYITGKLADITKKVLGAGEPIMPGAVLWSAAKSFLHLDWKNRIR